MELIDIDTLFYIDNRGLTRILASLNGHAFTLVTDPAEVHQSANAFLIPQHGDITIHIGAYIEPGEISYLELLTQGPPESGAEIIIGDLFLPGQEIAYTIRDLQELPAQFALLGNYPNPFRTYTTLVYDIPAHRTNGLDVEIAVFDMLGRRVRTLARGRRFPGRFTVRWDGTDGAAQPVASGVYVCRIIAGEMLQTIKLVRVK